MRVTHLERGNRSRQAGITSMAELVDQKSVLEKINSFKPLWRILLATPGTLQSTLSAYFGTPISVEVTGQEHKGDVIHRKVNLFSPEKEMVVCRAVSDIELEDKTMRRMIEAKEIGIGQIIRTLEAGAEFHLHDVGQANGTFWREYTLVGAGFKFVIKEDFPKILYADVHHDGA